MGVNFYQSTDASAPVLTGQAGSLTTLLDAILVNGYGSQLAAGWTIAYTATSKRDYKQGAGSNGFYLDVNDAAPVVACEARMRGYETMTALATGTNPFPTTAQQSTFGTVCRKSATNDATARPWYCIADSTCFYLFVDTGDLTNPSYSTAFMFGDFFSYKAGDTYNTAIIGRSQENGFGQQSESLCVVNPLSSPNWQQGMPGKYLTRSWTGVGGAVSFGNLSSGLVTGTTSQGNTNGPSTGTIGVGDFTSGNLPYPNGTDGSLELAPMYVVHSNSIRGYLKGLWAPCHRQPLGHGDTFSGTGNMAGKTFKAFNMAYMWGGTWSHQGGQMVIETSNTWS